MQTVFGNKLGYKKKKDHSVGNPFVLGGTHVPLCAFYPLVLNHNRGLYDYF